MRGDPYQTTGRFGNCETCHKPLKGEKIIYWPKGRHAYCLKCGEEGYRRFLAELFDERGY